MSDLTRCWLADALAGVTYKPGYRFTLYDHPHEGVWLRIDATVPDSTSADDMLDLGIDVPIPPMETVEQFHRWLHWRLTRHEIHEACEWFKVDGTAIYNPHIPHRPWGPDHPDYDEMGQ